jgi:hypothetical protein
LVLLIALPATAQYRIMISTDFPPVGVVKGGERVPNTLKSDPDDMQSMVRFLQYAWYSYSEASSYDGPVTVVGEKASSCIVRIPEAAAGESLHLLLEVRDEGAPPFVAYRRMIVGVRPAK